jgi:hypothetical protein
MRRSTAWHVSGWPRQAVSRRRACWPGAAPGGRSDGWPPRRPAGPAAGRPPADGGVPSWDTCGGVWEPGCCSLRSSRPGRRGSASTKTGTYGFTSLAKDQLGASRDSMQEIVQAAVPGLLLRLGHTVTEPFGSGDLLVLDDQKPRSGTCPARTLNFDSRGGGPPPRAPHRPAGCPGHSVRPTICRYDRSFPVRPERVESALAVPVDSEVEAPGAGQGESVLWGGGRSGPGSAR